MVNRFLFHSHQPLELMGEFSKERGAFETLAQLPTTPVGIGDLPAFVELLGGSKSAAALLGLDLWSKGRIMFIGGDQRRRKRAIFCSF